MNNLKNFSLIFCLLLTISCATNNEENIKKSDINNKKHNHSHRAALLNVELGEKYLAQGQIARAKKKLVHALELDPKSPEVNTAMGYFFETVGDEAEAEKYYLKSLEYGNGQGSFYNSYAMFLCATDRYTEADKAFENSLKDKTYPLTAEVYENRGICLLKAANDEKAKKYLEMALKYDPTRSRAMSELAELEFNRANYKSVISYMKKYSDQVDLDAKTLWLSIQASKKIGELDMLKECATKLKNNFRRSPEYKLYIAYLDEE